MPEEVFLAAYTKERETKNFVVYSRQNELGRKESQYVAKTKLPNSPPERVEVLVRF